MSIKNAIRRLENKIAKNGSSHSVTFVIPYCKDRSRSKEMQQKLLLDHNLVNSESLVVFAIDFAKAA
jgi:hypothetical protein